MLVEVYALEDDCCRLKRILSTLVPGGHGPLATVLVNYCGSVWWRCAGKSRFKARTTANHRFAGIRSARPKEGREVGERRALTLKAGQGMAEREIRTLDSVAGLLVFKTGHINHSAISPTILICADSREDSQQQKVEKWAGLHFLLSCHCVSKAHLHTLIHDELRVPITFKCERAPCPDIESRSVCTAQAGLSPPSVPS